ncbi:MAG: hypothetical protein H0W15_03470 [Gemmatimonadales bacterium]|nr:hypothetical protein [Gemmatimonadales bacterium]
MRAAALFLATAVGISACGTDLSGLKSEDEYPYTVNLIFQLEQDASVECLPLNSPCQVRLKGNITSRFGIRLVDAQIYSRAAPATTFSPLVRTDASGIFNTTISLPRTPTGRSVTLCAGPTLEVALTGACPTVTIP